MKTTKQPAARSWEDAPLPTDLVWKPRAYSNVRSPKRGALVGTLLGVPVDGRSTGRGVAFQIGIITGEVRTVWWDGTMAYGSPELFDVDTQEPVLRNPQAIAWFALLADVAENAR